MNQQRLFWPLSLLLLAMVFATMAIPVRYLNTEFSIFTQTYLRVILAFILSYIFFHSIRSEKILKISRKDWIILTIRGLLTYSIWVTAFSYSIVETKISNAAFIQAIPWVALFWWTLLREKFRMKDAILVIIACIWVIFIWVKDFSHLWSFGKGETAAVISSLAFALSYIMRRWLSEELNNQELTFIQLGIGWFFVLIVSLILWEWIPPLESFTSTFILWLLIISWLLNVANLWLTNYWFSHSSAIVANNILSTEWVFALLLGFLFFKELPNTREIIGSLLIMGSVILINTRSRENNPP